MSSIKYCERCGKEIETIFGSGRFCSKACANTRVRTPESKAKVSEAVRVAIDKRYEEGCACEQCGELFHSKDFSRKLCFNCLPSTVRKIKVKEAPKSIYDLSKRTVSKIFKRMELPCSCCGFFIKGVMLDIHHIKPRHEGGTDDMSNLTYICPNCHRIAHTDVNLLNKQLVSIDEQLKESNKDWKDFYFGYVG